MARFVSLWLVFLFTACTVCATDSSTPCPPPADDGCCLYLYTHPVSHPVYGKQNANDHLRVVSKDDEKMTFQLTTIGDEYHECLIMGEADKSGAGIYEYRENKCRLTFVFSPGEVAVTAEGREGAFCRVADLRTGHGCGYNTLINSSVYRREVKKPESAGQ